MKKVAVIVAIVLVLTCSILSVKGYHGTDQWENIEAHLIIKPDPPHVCQDHYIEWWFVDKTTGNTIVPPTTPPHAFPSTDTMIHFLGESVSHRRSPNATGHYETHHHFTVQGINVIQLEFGIGFPPGPLFSFQVNVEGPKPKIGVKCKIHFNGINVTDDKWACQCDPEIQNADNHTFSIQQNYFLKLSNGTVYWVQGGYDVCYNGTPCVDLEVYVRQWVEIWWVNVTGCSSEAIDITPPNREVRYFGGCEKVGKPSHFTLEIDSYIKGTKVMMSGLQATPDKEALDWKNASVTGKIVTDPADTDVQKNHTWENRKTSPQQVLVGLGDWSKAQWKDCTSGWVESYDGTSLKEGVPQWVQDNTAQIVDNSDHSTGELSHGMIWTWDREKKRGEFEHDDCNDKSGIAPSYVPRKAPKPKKTYSPIHPVVSQMLAFDASASYDPDGTIETYKWDFGDDTPAVIEADPIATHTYTYSGTYAVTLTVTDNDGLDNTHKETITIYSAVGGISVPVDKFGLLAPYIGLASTIFVATVAASIYAQRVKRRKEKQ